VIERSVEIPTADGEMKTFVYHPEHGGPHPVVLYLMDAPGIRGVLKEMATRLASAGYYVLLPYLFHRGGPFREFTASDEDMHARRELMGTVTPAGIVTDAEALVAFADADDAAALGPVGVIGFCMSGGLTITVANAFPDRVRAAASIHGGWLVRDTPDSPHRNLDAVRAEVYLAWCANDPTAPEDTIPPMREALEAAGIDHTIDFIDWAVHGFAPKGTERYDRRASELHWERVHALLRRQLPQVTVT
jgi:carboxymethylenebutenolidase